MGKCVIHANCQASPLLQLFATSPQFANYWQDIAYFVNFKKTPIPDSMLENCDLFLYQYLGEDWGELASKKIISRLPKHTKTISIPNVQFRGYWPLISREISSGEWGDIFVDLLLKKKLDVHEIIHILRNTDPVKHYDLDDLRKKSINLERQKNYVGVNELCDFIEENWQTEQLFTTPSHPAGKTLLFIVNQILNALELNPVSLSHEDTQKLYCDRDFFLPINPFIGTHYNLPFVYKDQQYPFYGKSIKFFEYVTLLIKCRQKNVPILDFYKYLSKMEDFLFLKHKF